MRRPTSWRHLSFRVTSLAFAVCGHLALAAPSAQGSASVPRWPTHRFVMLAVSRRQEEQADYAAEIVGAWPLLAPCTPVESSRGVRSTRHFNLDNPWLVEATPRPLDEDDGRRNRGVKVAAIDLHAQGLRDRRDASRWDPGDGHPTDLPAGPAALAAC